MYNININEIKFFIFTIIEYQYNWSIYMFNNRVSPASYSQKRGLGAREEAVLRNNGSGASGSSVVAGSPTDNSLDSYREFLLSYAGDLLKMGDVGERFRNGDLEMVLQPAGISRDASIIIGENQRESSSGDNLEETVIHVPETQASNSQNVDPSSEDLVSLRSRIDYFKEALTSLKASESFDATKTDNIKEISAKLQNGELEIVLQPAGIYRDTAVSIDENQDETVIDVPETQAS